MLDRLSPATRRVIAAAEAHRRRFGRPMWVSALARLCRAEGASLGAVAVVTRGLAPGRSGWPVRLDDPAAAAVLSDADTAWALVGRQGVRARVESIAGEVIDEAQLREHAERMSA